MCQIDSKTCYRCVKKNSRGVKLLNICGCKTSGKMKVYYYNVSTFRKVTLQKHSELDGGGTVCEMVYDIRGGNQDHNELMQEVNVPTSSQDIRK